MARDVWIAINTTWNVFNFRRALIAGLLEAGYGVTVFAPPDEYVEKVRSLGVRYIPMQLNNAGVNPIRELGSLLRMVRLFRSEKPDLLLTFTPKVNIYVALAARICGISVIANVSGLGRTFIAGGLLMRITRILYKTAFSWPRHVFFQNDDDRAVFLESSFVKAEKTSVLSGSGVDTTHFSPWSAQRRTADFVFLLAARLLWDKGVREYVEAARAVKSQFPKVQFRLAGFLDIPSPSAVPTRLVEQWHEEGIVDYVGCVDDMAELYRDVDCVVLPSYREGMPKTLLEAASMGLPVITTDVPGCRQAVVDGLTGFLVRARDSSALGEAMKRMLDLSPEQRVLMGRCARQRVVERFDERAVVARYLVAISGVLNLGAPRNLQAEKNHQEDNDCDQYGQKKRYTSDVSDR